MQLTGHFKIEQWNESTETDFKNGSKLNIASIKQSYNGDIEGTSTAHYHLYYKTEASAIFNGFEYLECKISGQACQLVLKHNGQFNNGVASSNFEVVEASEKIELIGKTGSFKAPMGGQASYQIND